MPSRILHVDRPWRKGYAARVPISLTVEGGPYAGVSRAVVLTRMRKMIEFVQLRKAELSIVLTDDKRIHELNKMYRGKDRPTDVLAFAMHEGEFGALAGRLLGDVVVSVPTARRQAISRGAVVLDEVTMLLAHGLLHLLGWDHDTASKDRRMRAETDRLCAAAIDSKGGAATSLSRKQTGGHSRSRPKKGQSTRARKARPSGK